MGGIDKIKYKICSLAHSENDLTNNKIDKNLKIKIEKGEDLFKRNLKINYIPLNNSFPKTILINKVKYSNLIYNSNKN